MNVFHKVAFQGLRKSPGRTFVTILGVILSAAMITAVCTFGVSLLRYMAEGAAVEYGGWHAAFLDVPADFAQARSRDPEISQTAVLENLGVAPLEAPQNPKKPYLILCGYDQTAFADLPIQLIAGRLPENSGEVVVSAAAMTDGALHLSVGDTLSLSTGSRSLDGQGLGNYTAYQEGEQFLPQATHSYTVVGLCRTPSYLRSAPGYPLITTADHAPLSDNCSVFLTLQQPYGLHGYLDRAAQGQHVIQNDEVLRFMGLSNDKLFTSLLLAVGGVVLAIIMLGSVFLIHNAFSISLNERTHQLGILMSVGATAKQLRSSVLFEGVCIGLVGIPLGILLGLAAMEGVLLLVAEHFESFMYEGVDLTLVPAPPVLALAALVSLLTILLSAYVPARKASNTPVMDCIRQTGELKVEATAMRTSRLFQRLYGLEGDLALKNFKRNKKRYRSIILSLVLSVVLFISTSAFAQDLKQASEMANVATSFDISLTVAEDMDQQELLSLLDATKSVQGITSASYEEMVPCAIHLDPQLLSPDYLASEDAAQDGQLILFLLFLDDQSFQQLLLENNLSAGDYTGESGKLLTIAKRNPQLNRILAPEEFPDLFTVSSLTLPLSPITQSAPEGAEGPTMTLDLQNFLLPDSPGTLSSSPIIQEGYIMTAVAPLSQKAQLVPPDAQASAKGLTYCSDTPAQSTKALQALVMDQGIRSNYLLLNLDKAIETNQSMMFIANVFAYVFIVMISLIAVANVFNTISTNIKLRRRELAMLRSVGMAEGDFQKMMNFECFFYGLRALLLGIPLSLLLSWVIYWFFTAGGADDLSFQLPWASVAISIGAVFLVVFITMLYAVRQLKKENIIDAMRDELT